MTGSAERKVSKYCDVASVMVEDDGEPPTMKLFCQGFYNGRQDAIKEGAGCKQVSSGNVWVAEKRKRGTLATGRGLEHKITRSYAANKMYATNMLKDAIDAVSRGKELLETSPNTGQGVGLVAGRGRTCGCRAKTGADRRTKRAVN